MIFRKTTALSFILLFLLLSLISCGIGLMPSKDAWYAQHYFIMQDFEREAYKGLSPAAKLEFQNLFWEARSAESKKEFDKRIAFIAKAFKKENARQPWNTDKGRIYLLNGDPNQIDYRQNTDWAMRVREGAGISGSTDDRTGEDIQANTAEVWIYRYDKYIVNYVFTFKSPNQWHLDQTSFSGNRYYGALETQSREITYGLGDIDQYKKKLENLKSIK
jgi:GWxTD domain-containing protein